MAEHVEQIKSLTEGIGSVDIVNMALTWPAHSSNEHGWAHVWESLAPTVEDAEAYLRSLPAEDAADEASIALAAAGWTRSTINFRRS